MHARNYLWAILLTAGLLSCATAPKLPTGPASASLRLVPEDELVDAYGSKSEENPFVAPSSLVTGKARDFIVLELKLSLPEAAHVEIDASISGLKGRPSAILNARDLSEYLALFNLGSPSEKARRPIIERWCLPDTALNLKAGLRSYYVVVACDHPYPSDAHVMAQAYIGGVPVASIDKELPPLKTVKSLFGAG
jgi:hypothetical protein